MPRVKLTATSVPHLKTDRAQVDYFDSYLPGFGVRVTRGGTRTYIVMTRELANGQWRKRRVKLGRTSELTLADARVRARAILTAASEGKHVDDVAPPTPRDLLVEQSKQTFAKERERFLSSYRGRGGRRPVESTLGEYRRCLQHNVLESWTDVPVQEITHDDVKTALQTVLDDGHESRAVKIYTVLKLLFGWLCDENLISTSPFTQVKRPAHVGVRERVLSEEELILIWNHAGEGIYANIVRIMMLTGQRRQEVAGMCWSEINLDKRRWDIPGQRTKNHRPHVVPLSSAVISSLHYDRSLQASTIMQTDLVFTTNGKAVFAGWSKSKERLDRRVASADWQLRDLRRSFATHANELGYEPHVIESALNHVSGSAKRGIAGVYNRATYIRQRIRLMQRWSRHLLLLVAQARRS